MHVRNKGAFSLSKGEMEDKISRLLTQWEKEYLGRGSLVVKTDLLRNMVIVVMKGILTPAEQQLAKSQDGLLSIKQMRSNLVETGSEQLYAIIEECTRKTVTSLFTDISTRTGERVMVFMLDQALT